MKDQPVVADLPRSPLQFPTCNRTSVVIQSHFFANHFTIYIFQLKVGITCDLKLGTAANLADTSFVETRNLFIVHTCGLLHSTTIYVSGKTRIRITVLLRRIAPMHPGAISKVRQNTFS